jgi:hypothetical protein
MKRFIPVSVIFTIVAIIAGVVGCSDSPIVPETTGTGSLLKVLPPNSHSYGKNLAQWSAEWWKWGMSLPVEGPFPPHPFVDDPNFDVTWGQSGKVWFLAAPGGSPVERTCTIPNGKALFICVIGAEASDLEGLGNTEAEQRAMAASFADIIVEPFCTVDGVPLQNIGDYRVSSPQFTFTAPDPWIFSPAPGGTGTSVSDGYFVMLTPLSTGAHTLHYGGSFDFGGGNFYSFDMTYHLTVQ